MNCEINNKISMNDVSNWKVNHTTFYAVGRHAHTFANVLDMKKKYYQNVITNCQNKKTALIEFCRSIQFRLDIEEIDKTRSTQRRYFNNNKTIRNTTGN